jgi:micrococcal nuclease
MIALALATILRVVDGDTVRVELAGVDVPVRVLHLDCPESSRNRKCLRLGRAACDEQLPDGRRATARAELLLHAGDVVTLEGAGVRDRYGRLLASVKLRDGRDFAELMKVDGLCR